MMDKESTRFRFWRWLISFIGVIVPRRLRADWRLEWEAELRVREASLKEWNTLASLGRTFLPQEANFGAPRAARTNPLAALRVD
jgi:hypothetical protein